MITVIDYGLGNLASIYNMFKKIGIDVLISSDKEAINKATKLILPGVGSFDAGMDNLHARDMIPLLDTKVNHEKTLILGICLGLHLFTASSEEGKNTGLGWLKAKTLKFKKNYNDQPGELKIPHMGWNEITIQRSYKLIEDLPTPSRFYFAHSYYIICDNQQDILTTTNYGTDFASIIQCGNILGAQFHPEKSHKFGMQLLRNFAAM